MRNLDWRTKAFLIGGAVGALLGLGAAYIYVNSVEKEGAPPEIQPTEAVGIGLALLAVLRQIATLHEGDRKKKRLR
jgi:Co/Zn/Cd efflux system component